MYHILEGIKRGIIVITIMRSSMLLSNVRDISTALFVLNCTLASIVIIQCDDVARPPTPLTLQQHT
jgi:hypothetical protein